MSRRLDYAPCTEVDVDEEYVKQIGDAFNALYCLKDYEGYSLDKL